MWKTIEVDTSIGPVGAVISGVDLSQNLEEEVISEAPEVEEAHHNDEGKEPMEEEEKHEGKDHMEEEETHEGEKPMEEAEDAHEAQAPVRQSASAAGVGAAAEGLRVVRGAPRPVCPDGRPTARQHAADFHPQQ